VEDPRLQVKPKRELKESVIILGGGGGMEKNRKVEIVTVPGAAAAEDVAQGPEKRTFKKKNCSACRWKGTLKSGGGGLSVEKKENEGF